ncbi:oligosaccharide repeat unit polymerase [Desulfofundulus australicus DSM 11792]|uniref:Oligosaccharide repeat unit polymerase n=1 Tax=Desulfofundulus australicus DSM 11792 TaxID=1121425 RepID=A0A1M4VFS3_9FIRM|nr:O-antigen polymerase [Desulfofundulus australicus]SHE67742.1 oligosaccharide repeat unit polymerase [Desulfofundulus australicus DSM 11792]
MKLTQNGLLLGLLVAILGGLATFFLAWQTTGIAIIFSTIASILLIFLGRRLTGYYTNFTVIFLTFSALYGLTGPIAAYYGEGLPNVFPTPYLVDNFLFHYSLAIIAMSVGLVVSASVKITRINVENQMPRWNERALLVIACAFAGIASLMEIVNLFRVGGIGVLLAGKAAYQSAVSDQTGTLPSVEITLLATTFLGLCLSAKNVTATVRMRRLHLIVLWLALASPEILILLVLGRRGSLLSLLVVLIISYSFFSPIKRINSKWFAIALTLYLIMGFMYGSRAQIGHALATGELSALTMRMSKPEFWATSLNPANNEFGAPFGNFNTYVLSGMAELRWGETYLIGLTIPIPRFIWPDKPQSIVYEFRDTFFSDWAQRGTIAGTAYSSILEAYVNFGTLGVPVVYFLIALAMGWLEKMRSRSRSLAFTILYLTLLPEAITFHRSSLEMPLFWPSLLALVGVGSYIVINSMIKYYRPAKGCCI